jgi:transcriptional regulator with XRE-family HTH domain
MVERIRALCEEHGITLAKLERTLNIGNGVIRKWDSSTPSVGNLRKVAKHFNVTMEYLLSGQ